MVRHVLLTSVSRRWRQKPQHIRTSSFNFGDSARKSRSSSGKKNNFHYEQKTGTHLVYIALLAICGIQHALLWTSKPCIDNEYFIQRSHRERLVIWKIISVEMQQIVKVLTLFAIPKYLKTLHSQTKYTPLINGPDQKIQKRVYKILLYQVSPKMCL